jgi:hypothetical protein
MRDSRNYLEKLKKIPDGVFPRPIFFILFTRYALVFYRYQPFVIVTVTLSLLPPSAIASIV